MVFKIVRAGRKIRDLHRTLDSEKHLHKYMSAREKKKDRHPLHEDIEILHKDVEWLRFSKKSSLYLQNLGEREKKEEELPESPGHETPLPYPFIEDIMLNPENWSGKNVIMEGDIEFYNRKKNGERWHIFSDPTGMVTAVSEKELRDGAGTLFGVAWQTKTGKQVFLEIKNFHPR
jgi:hypothetical protein